MKFIFRLWVYWLFFSQTPHDSQNFRFDLVIASFRIGERDGEREKRGVGEREGGRGGMEGEIERVGREGVSEREILCQHSTISEEYFDVDSSVDYQHFTRVVKAKTAACRYVRFRWRTCFFFFFISSDFSVIIWGRRNGIEYHYFTESCPVRPPPLTPHFPYISFTWAFCQGNLKKSRKSRTQTRLHVLAHTHARTHTRSPIITGPVYRIITNTFTSLTLYCSVRFPGR